MNIKKPVISEKSTKLAQEGRYVFIVNKKVTKTQIAELIKKMYQVDPIKINILRSMGKRRRRGRFYGFRPGVKKVIVKVKKGQKIADFEIKE